MRHKLKKLKTKSQESDGPVEKKRKAFRVLQYPEQSSSSVCNNTDEDLKGFVTEIQKEWAKPAESRDTKHIQVLMRQTKDYRKMLLIDTPSGSIEPIIREFPCLQESSYLLYDLTVLLGGKERVTNMALNLKKILFAVENLMDLRGDQEDKLRMLPVIQFTEKETGYERQGATSKKGEISRAIKTKPIIKVVKDVAEDQVNKAVATEEGSAPHLVSFISTMDNTLQGLYIVGVTVKIEVPVSGGIMGGVMKLIAVYYVFDLQHPRQYSMLMAVLQTFLMDEPFKGTTTQKYKFFIKKLRNELQKLPEPEEENKV